MTQRYVAIPFTPTPDRAAVVSHLLREICKRETVFAGYARICDAQCFDCPQCAAVMIFASRQLAAPNARVWEVWDTEAAACVGVLYVTDVVAGADALGHYVFFDGQLGDKTQVIEGMIQWVFADHDDWRALRRLTIEIPAPFYALARHATNRLGFGGGFTYRNGKNVLAVEGVRRNAVVWRGAPCDTLILGRLNT